MAVRRGGRKALSSPSPSDRNRLLPISTEDTPVDKNLFDYSNLNNS
jgi:hypothetical protein